MRPVGIAIGGLLSVLTVACGDPAVADLSVDMSVPHNGMDAAVRDAAPSRDTGPHTERDFAVQTDAPPPVVDLGEDAGSSEIFGSYLDQFELQVSNRCNCDDYLTAHDYGLTSICLGAEEDSYEKRMCKLNALLENESAFLPRVNCLLPKLNDLVTCYWMASCGDSAEMSCDTAYTSASASCPAITGPEQTAYDEDYTRCMIGDGADTCDEGATASSETGIAVFYGTTIGAGDHHSAFCAAGDHGADKTFKWTAPATGMYTFDTRGSNFDTVLYLMTGCDALAPSACDDNSAEDGKRSVITASLGSGAPVYIVVDGAQGSEAGDFSVSISRVD